MGPKGAAVFGEMLTSGGGEKLIAAMSSLNLSNNPGILGELEPVTLQDYTWLVGYHVHCCSGRLKTADVHFEQFKQIADAIGQLPNLTSLNLAGIGMGPKGAAVFGEMLTSGGGE
eukprot:SAG31_NODE_33449_length_343_cov_3.131148_1_plen_114_part_11